MIIGLGLSNVRLFEDLDHSHFPLTRLNVLCGTNSAGKSTIVKSLLLLIQSHTSFRSSENIGQLRYSGPLVDLGGFESIVTHRDVSRDMTIELHTMDIIKTNQLKPLRKLRGKQVAEPDDDLTGYILESKFRFGFVESRPENVSTEPTLPFEVGVPMNRSWARGTFLKEASFNFETENDLKMNWTLALKSKSLAKHEMPEYEILIPSDYFETVGGYKMMDVEKVEPGSHLRIPCALQGLLPGYLWAKPRRKSGDDDDQDSVGYPIPPIMFSISSDLDAELRDVHYIGPLRSPAKRFYISKGDNVSILDATGEFLPHVLKEKGDTSVEFALPVTFERAESTLGIAVNLWLHYLRTGDRISIKDASEQPEFDTDSVKDIIVEFALKSFDEELYSLADSGFGYSQLLPIIVRGLIAEPHETLIVEQPEVHLNPALQIRIAEFLFALVQSNRYVLVETHSEHIVNALRVLVAEGRGADNSPEFTILYLSIESGRPRLRHLEVQEDGTVPDWPREFMGEAIRLSSRLLKAQDKMVDTNKKGK